MKNLYRDTIMKVCVKCRERFFVENSPDACTKCGGEVILPTTKECKCGRTVYYLYDAMNWVGGRYIKGPTYFCSYCRKLIFDKS